MRVWNEIKEPENIDKKEPIEEKPKETYEQLTIFDFLKN